MSKPTLMAEITTSIQGPIGPRDRSRRRGRVIGLIIYICLLSGVYGKALIALTSHVASSELHSYILLIPLVSAYLLYERRRALPQQYAASPISAAALVVVAIVTLVLAERSDSLSENDYLSTVALSFVCFFWAGVLAFLGRLWTTAAIFPIAFLVFIVPMPDIMSANLETASQLASTEAANLFFHLFGMPILRDGTRFQLPDIAIEVGKECSGIRSSWVLLITSMVAANLFLRRPWRRLALVCFVFPLAILRNGFRVFVIGLLCVEIGPNMINSLIHRRGGPLFFTLSLVPLFVLLWWLRRTERRPKSDVAQQAQKDSSPTSTRGVSN
jgi:exosortase C (VPDSG-CTERM-specific)